MDIITGYTGQNHIESGDVQALLRGIMGANQFYVLNTGMELEPEIVDANTIRINSGDIVFQGVHCRIPYGEYDTVTIDNGSGDYDRRDVIALRYEKDAETGEESVDWAYYKGGSNGHTPTVTTGNIEEGDLVAEVIIFTIIFDRMTISRIRRPESMKTLNEIQSAAIQAEINVQTKAEANDVIYKANDTAELYFDPVCGEVYANKNYLKFFVPLSRPIKGVTRVTITAGSYQAKANNAVIVSQSSLVNNISKTVTLHQNGITVLVYKASGFAGSGNAVCAVSGNMTVKFLA